MKNILENHLARKLILIELLYNKKKYIQIEDAIEILDCSKNTLLKDILEINNYFYIIEFEKNKGFFLNKERGINFNFIYGKLLTESMSVQLLFNILTSEATITDISHDMFVSESKVRKIVSRWNCYINSRNFSFEISVEKNKLILEGNETVIRLFCHYMLLELNYSNIFEPETSDSQLYSVFKANVLAQYENVIPLDEYELRKMYYFMLTSLYRIKNGHTDNNRTYKKMDLKTDSNMFRELNRLVIGEFNLELNEQLMNQIIHHSFLNGIYQNLSTSQIEKKRKYEHFIDTILDYFPKSTITSEKREKISKKLALILLYSRNVLYFLIDHNDDVYKYHVQQYHEFFNVINTIADNDKIYFTSQENKQFFLIQLVYTLNSELGMVKYTMSQPTVAIYAFATLEEKNGLRNVVKMFFGDRIKVLVIADLDDKSTDIVITNYVLPSKSEGIMIHYPGKVTLDWLYDLAGKLEIIERKYHNVFSVI